MIDDDSAGALRRGARTNRSAADKPARPQKRASTDLNPMSRTPDRFRLSCEAPTGGARCEEKTMKYVIDLDEKLRRSGQMVYNEGLRSVARSLGRSVAKRRYLALTLDRLKEEPPVELVAPPCEGESDYSPSFVSSASARSTAASA
jgi:hypothetical protein